MLSEQIRARGVQDERVLEAMERVPRHLFVSEGLRARAYDDTPLPIGERQTISQPYIVALMTEMLDIRVGDRVLEVGTGCGYQAAILAEMGARVISLERIPELAAQAQALLAALGYHDRVTVEVTDGTCGWPAAAPYAGIVVTAAGPELPRPLLGQLATGGHLVLPMGDNELQELVRLRRDENGLVEEYRGSCRFVKLIGEHGWRE